MCQLRRIYSFCVTRGLTEYPIFVVTGRHVLRWAVYDETKRFTKQTCLKVDGDVKYFFELGEDILSFYFKNQGIFTNDGIGFIDIDYYSSRLGYHGQSTIYYSDYYTVNPKLTTQFLTEGSFFIINPVVVGAYIMNTFAKYYISKEKIANHYLSTEMYGDEK